MERNDIVQESVLRGTFPLKSVLKSALGGVETVLNTPENATLMAVPCDR